MEIPITQIRIAADKTKLPYSFVAIDKSYDAADDTDLWKDDFLRRSYLGLQIINEREEVPVGFSTLETTLDSNAVNDQLLNRVFGNVGQSGQLLNVRVVGFPEGQSRACAFVSFQNRDEAERAMQKDGLTNPSGNMV